MNGLVTLQEIREAAARVRPFARVTPLLDAGEVPGARRLWLKCENLQRSGAFKVRGAANMLLQLDPDVRGHGVITYSSGNHGLALALTARDLACPAVIVMPENAPAVKADGARALGAEVVFEGRTTIQRKARAEAEAARRGLTVVPPFDHRWILAGQGTLGLEVLEQCPDLTAVLVPASGGGLLGGVAAAIKGLTPGVRVVAVEPAVTPRLTRSLHAGHAVTVEPGTSIADGLLAVRAGDVPFAHAAALVDEVVTIDDESVRDTVRWLFEHARLVAEPSGAAAPGAARVCAPTTWSRDGRSFRDTRGVAVAVISGGNVEAAAFAKYIVER